MFIFKVQAIFKRMVHTIKLRSEYTDEYVNV